MKMTEDGCDALILQLRNAAFKVPENARKVMHRGADKILKEAVLNAPVDDGQLEKSGHIEKGYEESGRLKIDVAFGGVVDGVDVDKYVNEIHENYEGMTPGDNTLAKRAANPGRYIGGQFLARAAADQKPKLEKAIIESVIVTTADIK